MLLRVILYETRGTERIGVQRTMGAVHRTPGAASTKRAGTDQFRAADSRGDLSGRWRGSGPSSRTTLRPGLGNSCPAALGHENKYRWH